MPRGLVDDGVIDAVAIAALALGRIKRQVGISHHVLVAEARSLLGDAHRGADLDLVAEYTPVLVADAQDHAAEIGQTDLGHPLDDDPELVAPQAGEDAVGGHHGGHGRADLAHQVIACVVAKGVVHRLEPVQVDQQHSLLLPAAGQAGGQLVNESRPVQDARQSVVPGRMHGDVHPRPEFGHLGVEQADRAVALGQGAGGVVHGPVALGDPLEDLQGVIPHQRRQQEGQLLGRRGDLDAGGEHRAVLAVGDHNELGIPAGCFHQFEVLNQVGDRFAPEIEQEHRRRPAEVLGGLGP